MMLNLLGFITLFVLVPYGVHSAVMSLTGSAPVAWIAAGLSIPAAAVAFARVFYWAKRKLKRGNTM
jgi:O-antigen ligase